MCCVCFKVKIVCILAENFPVSRNLAENSNSRQNMANPNISHIFDLAGFIFKKITAKVSIRKPNCFYVMRRRVVPVIKLGMKKDHCQSVMTRRSFRLQMFREDSLLQCRVIHSRWWQMIDRNNRMSLSSVPSTRHTARHVSSFRHHENVIIPHSIAVGK